MKKENKGFTLIELLVVIAIIAILSTVVMAGLNSARAKGRDAKRVADIKALQSALELCSDVNDGYPPETGATIITTGAASAAALGPNTPCGTHLFSEYMATLPVNAAPGGADYVYTSTDPSSYSVTFSLEGATGSLASGAHTATNAGVQ